MIAWFWPSQTIDSPCLLESVGAVLDLGVTPEDCFVAHSPEKPVSEDAQNILRSQGIRFLEHDYSMRKNAHDIQTIAKTELKALALANATHVLKIDSDTVIARMDTIKKAHMMNTMAMAWAWPGSYFAGCCSLFRRDALDYLATTDFADLGGVFPGEDLAQHYLLTRRFGFDAIQHNWHSSKGGFATGWFYDSSKRTLEEAARLFEVVTFGNRKKIPKERGGCSAREYVALTMARFRSVLRLACI